MLNYVIAIILFLLAPLSYAAPIGDVMDSTVGIFVEYGGQVQNGNMPNQAYGSGVIISENGHIITNHHVIQGAQSIVVQTHDGQREYATIVGAAPEFDISVLKIQPLPQQALRPIKFANSNSVRPGDEITAVGNAFGFEQTLTKGVVSHVDRDVNLSHRVKSYIQVDAAINPGNSGGALLNEKGEMIGIVSGIFGPRFNIGIAFAIPTDIAGPVIQQLISKGYVSAGWIGMATQPLTPELKDAVGAQNYDGVFVSEVLPGSPAHRANLLPRDIILEVNDIHVSSPQHFASLITAQGSQSLLSVSYLRDNKVQNTRLKTEQPSARGNSTADAGGPWGVSLKEYYHRNLDGATKSGVQVNHVDQQSSASLSGLLPGDVIVSINNHPIKTLDDISKNKLSTKKTNLLEVSRQDHTFFVPLR